MPLNKENLTGLIKKILKEKFAKQEKNTTNFINGNFEITMKEIKKSQDEIKDLRKETNSKKVQNSLKMNFMAKLKTKGKTREY